MLRTEWSFQIPDSALIFSDFRLKIPIIDMTNVEKVKTVLESKFVTEL